MFFPEHFDPRPLEIFKVRYTSASARPAKTQNSSWVIAAGDGQEDFHWGPMGFIQMNVHIYRWWIGDEWGNHALRSKHETWHDTQTTGSHRIGCNMYYTALHFDMLYPATCILMMVEPFANSTHQHLHSARWNRQNSRLWYDWQAQPILPWLNLWIHVEM